MRYNNNTLYISRRNKNMTVPERLSALRKCMEEKNIDVYVVPTADFHQSEYVGEHFKARKFITGFSGSGYCFFNEEAFQTREQKAISKS